VSPNERRSREGTWLTGRNDMSKSLIRHMRDIMIELLEEASSVPSGVMDCIISQFEGRIGVSFELRVIEGHDKLKLCQDQNTPAFQLIQDVCNKTHHRLVRMIYAHFSEIQHSHGRSGEATTSDFDILADSHKLMITMYRYCPNLLINVVPLLEENLKVADEVQLRQLSTKTLGTIFGMRPAVNGGVADLAKTATAAWRSWVGRKVDRALPVRLAWVEAAGAILANQPDLRGQMESESLLAGLPWIDC
jgi:sister-chromatid-cohesion protein PDS5